MENFTRTYGYAVTFLNRKLNFGWWIRNVPKSKYISSCMCGGSIPSCIVTYLKQTEQSKRPISRVKWGSQRPNGKCGKTVKGIANI